MNYLVTGAAGFVGSHLCESLARSGHKICALDLGFSNEVNAIFSSTSNVDMVVGSVLDQSLINKLIDRSDIVVHLAAIASPEYYVKEPKRTIDLNLNASISIIEALRFTGKKIIYTSTSEIYGKNPNIPWKELDDRVLGSTDINRWCYSTSKSMIEHYLYACHQEGSLEFSGVRIFNCYGPRLHGRVVDSFVNSAINKTKLLIHGDGSQTRCFTYIDDLITALSTLTTSKTACNKFYNIGNNVETSIKDLAMFTLEILELDPINFIEYLPHSKAIGSSYEDIPRRVPDYSLALAELNWSPKVELKIGLKKMIDHQLTYHNLSNTSYFSEVDE